MQVTIPPQTPKAEVVVIEKGKAVPAPPIETPPKPRNKRRQVAGEHAVDHAAPNFAPADQPERFGVVDAPEPSDIIADAIDKAFPQ